MGRRDRRLEGLPTHAYNKYLMSVYCGLSSVPASEDSQESSLGDSHSLWRVMSVIHEEHMGLWSEQSCFCLLPP
jgi:hypothetical protein